MFITRKKLNEIIEKNVQVEIYEAFKHKGFGERPIFTEWSDFARYENTYPYTKPLERLEHKFNALLKHLGIEYYKKEIKETNGEIKEYKEEGFRKITKKKK